MLLQNLNHIFWNRNGSLRAFSFGLCQNQLCFCKSIYTLNPLNGFFDGQNPFSQVNILPLQSTQFSNANSSLPRQEERSRTRGLQSLSLRSIRSLKRSQKILEDKERLQWFASKVVNIKDAFFIGRGIDYAIGMEGSLKLKEIQLYSLGGICSRRTETRPDQLDRGRYSGIQRGNTICTL